MKSAVLSAIILLFCLQVFSQGSTTLPRYIYIVRHAEKGTGKDPELTDAGKQRAGDLMRALKDKHIQAIYVTQFKRTQMTGDSLRLQMGIDTVHYAADTLCNDLLGKIQARHDERILIIGHSNTIAYIIHKLGGASILIKDIPETEFNNLFLLTLKKGKAKLKAMKYGS